MKYVLVSRPLLKEMVAISFIEENDTLKNTSNSVPQTFLSPYTFQEIFLYIFKK